MNIFFPVALSIHSKVSALLGKERFLNKKRTTFDSESPKEKVILLNIGRHFGKLIKRV